MLGMDSDRAIDIVADCETCGDVALGGNLSWRRESRGDASTPWVQHGEAQQCARCEACYARTANALRSLAAGDLIRPDAPGGRQAKGRGRHGCDFCGGLIGNISFGVELAPRASSAGLPGARQQMIHQRVCCACWEWGRTLACTVAGGTPADSLGEGGAAVPSTVFTLGLGRQERSTVSSAAADAGVAEVDCVGEALGAFETDERSVLYVTASRATEVLSRTRDSAHRRIVVVAALTDMGATSFALRAGAGSFVTAPMSDGQARGSWAQILTPAPGKRDVKTGLPVLQVTPIQPDRATQYLIRLRNFDSMTLMSGAWLLRRFLRGSDLVGVDAQRNPAAVVGITIAELPNLVRRLVDVVSPSLECVPIESCHEAA